MAYILYFFILLAFPAYSVVRITTGVHKSITTRVFDEVLEEIANLLVTRVVKRGEGGGAATLESALFFFKFLL